MLPEDSFHSLLGMCGLQYALRLPPSSGRTDPFLARDTLICYECDRARAPAAPKGSSPGHLASHALVRIRDSSVVGQNATTEEKLSALQQRLVNLEHKVADGLAAIDSKVEEKLARLEARIEHRLTMFENNAESRFDTLEALLRQVAAQTSALPSLYGEVLREHLRTGRHR